MGGGNKDNRETLLVPASAQDCVASVNRNQTLIPKVSSRDVITQSSQGVTHSHKSSGWPTLALASS